MTKALVALFACLLCLGISCSKVYKQHPADECLGKIPIFYNEIQPIIVNSCAKAGCHDGKEMLYDFSVYSQLKNVLTDSSFYYAVIIDHRMPEDDTLSATQVQLLKCWAQNGYPEN